jgi:hypothetical protein
VEAGGRRAWDRGRGAFPPEVEPPLKMFFFSPGISLLFYNEYPYLLQKETS